MVSAEYIGGRTRKNHLPDKPGSKKRKETEALHKTFAGGSGLPQTFTHDPGTATRISSTPLLRDPFERARTEARPSSIPGAGEGLFAVRALAAGEIACFYSGIRIAHAVVNGRGWEENDNTLSVDNDTVVDVPPACVPKANYSATLGHKANHSFTPNARYEPFEHPRFGSIKCVRATQRVAKGAEVTCHYDYNEIGADGELVRLRSPTHTHSLSHQFLANYPLGPPTLVQPVTRVGGVGKSYLTTSTRRWRRRGFSGSGRRRSTAGSGDDARPKRPLCWRRRGSKQAKSQNCTHCFCSSLYLGDHLRLGVKIQLVELLTLFP
jgi:hypothetical protein